MELYEVRKEDMNCLNCVHLHQKLTDVGGKPIGGCFERMTRNGPYDFRHTHCGQFFLQQSTEEY